MFHIKKNDNIEFKHTRVHIYVHMYKKIAHFFALFSKKGRHEEPAKKTRKYNISHLHIDVYLYATIKFLMSMHKTY